MLKQFKNLFEKKAETMKTTCQSNQEQTTTCGVVGAVDQLSATSEGMCCGGKSCEQAIRERAYLLWERAGYPTTDGVEFWLTAEQELQSEKA